MGGSARRRGVGGADSSLQPSSAPLLQMAFTRNIFSGAPWGWGDNQLASGMRGASGELSVPRCRSCAWGHACRRPSGSQAGRNHLSPEHSSGGGKPSASRRPWVTALECFQCDRVNTSGVCVSGGGTCQTQGGQQCFLRKIYEDGTLSYGRQGCSQLCTPMKLFNPSVIVEYKCCHDSPLCNKF
uniref:Secreted protein of Ly-6 domain 1 n=1 Tax=Ovis aries TaxID=9940 RepID=A0AC11ENV5_SHEEP